MNEYLKIKHQDGLVFFSRFRIADLLLIKIHDNLFRLDLDIKTYDGPYSQKETLLLETLFSERINPYISYAWLTLENKIIPIKSESELDGLAFEINKGWEDDGGLASIYFGWAIELLNNQISFKTENNELYVTWKAESGDINHYDENAKPTFYEMWIKVNVTLLQKEDEIEQRWKRLANKSDRYYEILRNMNGTKIVGHDLDVADKVVDIGYNDSIEAWELTPKIMERFPKPDAY